MPKFFFHVQDELFYADEHGTELSDQYRARIVALDMLCHFVRGAENLWRGGAFCVFVEDARGTRLFTLEVRASRGPVGAEGAPSQN